MKSSSNMSIEMVKEQLHSMSHTVEVALEKAVKSLVERDIVLARSVIVEDKVINSFEIDIDNSTYNVLAVNANEITHEMMRTLLSIQKVNPMLERIGDHAVNISESAETLAVTAKNCELFGLPEMAKDCMKLVHDAICGFFDRDLALAEEVLERDHGIDRMNVEIMENVKCAVMLPGGGLEFSAAMDIIRISKNLERIADLGTNIAEEAQFSAIGRIVKHRTVNRMDNEEVVQI